MKCPGCGKEGPYTESNGYELRGYADREGNYRCEDCGEEFWWP
jgi:transposase-like protein